MPIYIARVLQGQKEKGVSRWMIVCSFVHAGLTERKIGLIMDIDPRTVHSMKKRPVEREIKNYFVMSASARSHFINLMKQVA